MSLARAKKLLLLLLMAILLSLLPVPVLAWPVTNDWNALTAFNSIPATPSSDVTKDGAGSRDIVGDATYPAGYTYNDGTDIFFRIRLNGDPRLGSGLDSFGWGFLIDTNGDLGDYEYMVMLDGINIENIYLAENTAKTNLSDPSDHAETIIWEEGLNQDPISGNYSVTVADSTFATNQPDPDYFLDFRMPFDIFKATLGLGDDSLVRYFIGSSSNAQSLTADLTAGTVDNRTATLSDGISDFVLPTGKKPATGSIRFVADISGAGDVTEFYPETALFLRVDDPDQNGVATAVETITVTLSAPSGDSESVTLSETGPDTGIFTGSIATADGPEVTADSTLQATPVEFVAATYTDVADADLNQNLLRSDSVKALPAADLKVTKGVDDSTPNEGDTVVYSITVENLGPSSAGGIQVTDQLPAGITYADDSGSGSYNPATGVWSVSPLAARSTATLNISATIDSGTTLSTITNSAAITAASLPDLDPGNDTDSASIAVTGADIGVTQTVSTDTPASGASITFTITVSNHGSYDATGVSVSDLLPAADLLYTGHSASAGSYTPASGLWDIGDLANGASQTLQLTATVLVPNGSVIGNSASVLGADQGDPNPANDTASTSLLVGGTDLELTKSTMTPNPNEGDLVTYTLILANLGSFPATNVQVTDLLPAGLTYDSSTPAAGTTYTPATGIWDVGTLAGGPITLDITARVDRGTASQTIRNSAAITAVDQIDPVAGNDSDSADITVDYVDIDITKTVDNATPDDGDPVTFTVTVNNNGPGTATGIQVFDQLPAQLTYTGSTATAPGSYDHATHLWDIGSLADGASATLTVDADVDIGQNDPPTFFNTAALHALDQGDPVLGNNASSVLLGVQGTDIAVSKIVDNVNPSSGDTVTYTVTVTNNGPNDATNLIISEILPAGLTYLSDSDDYAPAGTDQTAYNAGTGEWTVGHKSGGNTLLPSGTTVTLILAAQVTAANGTVLTNTAFLKNVDEADTDVANNIAQVTITVGGADLTIAHLVDNPAPTAGDTVNFTVTVTNSGPDTVTGVQVTDLLPAGLIYLGDTPAAGSSYDPGTGLWDLSGLTLAPGDSAQLVLAATLDAGSGGQTLTSTATVTTSDLPDPVLTDNAASASVTGQEADLAVTKSVDNATPTEGDTIVYTVTLTNNGPTAARGVQVTDLLPAGLTFVSAVPEPGSSYDPASGLWDLSGGPLVKSSSSTLTITATVNGGTASSNITNSVAVSATGQHDPAQDNDEANIAITPTPVNIDLSVTKAVDDPTPNEGSTATYTITVTNNDPLLTATGIALTDTLPTKLTYVSHSGTQGSFPTVPTVGDSGDLVWNVGSLSPGATASLTLTAATACGSFPETLSNSVSITAADQTDPDATNNSAAVDVTPTAATPNLTILKLANSATAKPGQDLTYTVQVSNFGCGKADNVLISDRLSSFVAWSLDSYGADQPFLFTDSAPTSGIIMGTPEYSSDNGTNWDHSPASGIGEAPAGYDATVTNWKIQMGGNLLPGGSFTLNYKAKIH